MNLKLFKIRLESGEANENDVQEINDFMSSTNVDKTATQFVPDEPDYWSVMVFYTEQPFIQRPDNHDLNDDQKEVYRSLAVWRSDKAKTESLPTFLIIQNALIIAIARLMPSSLEDLQKIKGMDEKKVAKYGMDIIGIVKAKKK